MALEEIMKTKVALRKTPSAEALMQIQQGRKFIVVDDDIDPGNIPDGYSLITMRHKGQSMKTLIPQSLLFFMANPGEGNPDDALDEIADFYGDARDFEEDMIADNGTSVQEANWATMSRSSYVTYLVNRLVKNSGKTDSDGEPVPEFNESVLNQLDLRDINVNQRVKAIAAVALGKTASQINASEVKDILNHVTIRKASREKLTREEFKKVACYCGSHWEVKPEYQNNPDVQYSVEHNYNREHMVGEKITKKADIEVLDSKIAELEKYIYDYRAMKHGSSVGRHDSALIRQYINMAYISKENPGAQLDIQPPEKPVKAEAK